MTDKKQIFKFLRSGEVSLMLGFPLIGAFFAFEKISYTDIFRISIFLIATFLLFSAIYSFNSYCGYIKDLQNLRLSYIRKSGRRNYAIFTLAFIIPSMLIYICLDSNIALIGGTIFILWFLYSLPEIGLKNFPFTGTVLHIVSQILHFQMGFQLLLPVSSYSLIISVYFALLFAGGHIHHELIDH